MDRAAMQNYLFHAGSGVAGSPSRQFNANTAAANWDGESQEQDGSSPSNYYFRRPSIPSALPGQHQHHHHHGSFADPVDSNANVAYPSLMQQYLQEQQLQRQLQEQQQQLNNFDQRLALAYGLQSQDDFALQHRLSSQAHRIGDVVSGGASALAALSDTAFAGQGAASNELLLQRYHQRAAAQLQDFNPGRSLFQLQVPSLNAAALLAQQQQQMQQAARMESLPRHQLALQQHDFFSSDSAMTAASVTNLHSSLLGPLNSVPQSNSTDAYAENGMVGPWSATSAGLLGKMVVGSDGHALDGSGGPGAVLTKKNKRKPKDRPKRPLSAYNIFFKEERYRILDDIPAPTAEELAAAAGEASSSSPPRKRRKRKKQPHGKIGFESLAKKIGQRWQELPPEQVNMYKKKAEADMLRYKREMQVYLGNKKKDDAIDASETSKMPASLQADAAQD